MITILAGTNDFARLAELKRLTADYIAEFGDVSLEKVDAENADYTRLRDALASPPFLASKKLVIVQALSGNKILSEKVEALLSEVNDTTDLILVEGKLDKRLAYFKFLKKQKGYKEFDELDANGLAKWAVAAAAEQGGSLSLGDARYLVDRSAANQMMLGHEIEKLVLYRPAISRETIDLLVDQAPTSSIFELLDAAFSGNAKRAAALYQDQRKQRVEPQQILAMLAWQLHILLVVKAAGQRSSAEIAKAAGISPYVVQKSQNLVRSISFTSLKDIVHDSLVLDIRLKSEPIDADTAVQNLLLKIAQ